MTTPLHVACYSDFRAWVRRRRRALVIAAGALGAGCLLYYGLSRYHHAAGGFRVRSREAAEEEEEARRALVQREAEERVLQLRQHFEGIQMIADTTTLPSVLQHLKERLSELVNLSGLTLQLLAGKEGPQALSHQEKMMLWQKLKILSFTRALCAAWGMGLAHLFVRVQLNLLGRHMYISTARDLSESREAALLQDLPMSAQHRFLAFADYLPYRGIQLLVQDTEEAVENVLRDVSLKKPYAFDQLKDLFIKIQAGFEEKHKDWCRYVLPDDNNLPEDLAAASSAADDARLFLPEAELQHGQDDKHEQLVKQTREVLSSVEFQEVLGPVMDSLLDVMVQDLVSHYQNQPAVGIPLAKLVPAVSSLGTTLLDNLDDNAYIQTVAALPQVKSFCAMVYGSPD